MPSNFKSAIKTRNACVDAHAAELDGGTGSGRCEIRGTPGPPTEPEDASTGTLLATPVFADPSFGASANGTASANPIVSDTNAAASGDAEYFRSYPGAAADTACVHQGTAGEAADTPDMTFDNKTITIGGTVAITSYTLTQPQQ